MSFGIAKAPPIRRCAAAAVGAAGAATRRDPSIEDCSLAARGRDRPLSWKRIAKVRRTRRARRDHDWRPSSDPEDETARPSISHTAARPHQDRRHEPRSPTLARAPCSPTRPRALLAHACPRAMLARAPRGRAEHTDATRSAARYKLPGSKLSVPCAVELPGKQALVRGVRSSAPSPKEPSRPSRSPHLRDSLPGERALDRGLLASSLRLIDRSLRDCWCGTFEAAVPSRCSGAISGGCHARTTGTGSDTPRAAACPRHPGSRRARAARRHATARTRHAG